MSADALTATKRLQELLRGAVGLEQQDEALALVEKLTALAEREARRLRGFAAREIPAAQRGVELAMVALKVRQVRAIYGPISRTAALPHVARMARLPPRRVREYLAVLALLREIPWDTRTSVPNPVLESENPLSGDTNAE